MKSALLAVGLSVAAAGCYRNIPTQYQSVATGNDVVVTLTSQGTARLAPSVGDFVTRIEGGVLSSDAGTMTIALHSVTRRGELNPTKFNGETVSLSQGDVSDLFTRQLSRGRTTTAFVVLGAASVAVVIALAKAVGILESSGNGNPTPPVP